jgi:hypothetical protein
MPTIWQELDDLKNRVADLERQDTVILEDSFELLNSEQLEQDIIEVIEVIRKLVRKYGKLLVNITTEN